MRMLRQIAVLFAALATLGGCTAIKAQAGLLAAQEAVLRADEVDAREHALYEYTLAIRYFEKAREEVGYSQYRSADELAVKAVEWAEEAIAETHRRQFEGPLRQPDAPPRAEDYPDELPEPRPEYPALLSDVEQP